MNNKKPTYSLLTLVLFISILAIGFSHVQTAHRLQNVTDQNKKLLILNQKLADESISPSLQALLESLEIKRWIDLAEMPEDEVWQADGFGETSAEELRALMKKRGITFRSN